MNEFPLTEQSPAGTYYVITHSRSIYQIVLDPDQQPRIIRYRAGCNVSLHDGESLTGVSAFRFDAVTGEGMVFWWKERPEDRDYPEGPYAGSHRRTSLVDLVLKDTDWAGVHRPRHTAVRMAYRSHPSRRGRERRIAA